MSAALSARKAKKLLTKSIKKVLSDSNISTSTRNGNKELDILVKQLAAAPFDSAAAVEKVGTALGEKIATLSTQNNKKDLDAGTVRKISLQSNWAAEFDVPLATATEKNSPKSAKSERTVVQLKTEKAETPEAEAPEGETPEAEASEADAKETAEAPEGETPEAEAAEVEASETAEAPESDAKETAEALEAEVPEAEAPEAEAPETTVPEEATEVSEAAEAESIEATTEAMGGGATAAPADPEAVAMANSADADTAKPEAAKAEEE